MPSAEPGRKRNCERETRLGRDSPREIILSWAGKLPQSVDLECVDLECVDLCSVDRRSVDLYPAGLCRRQFLIGFCQGAGAALIPAKLWGFASATCRSFALRGPRADPEFHLHPHYRNERPLDATLQNVQAGLDEFLTEKYADQIAATLAEWSAALLRSPRETPAIAKALAAEFAGGPLKPAESRVVRANSALSVRQNKFAGLRILGREAFLREWQSIFSAFSRIVTAEFQITGIEATSRRPPLRNCREDYRRASVMKLSGLATVSIANSASATGI